MSRPKISLRIETMCMGVIEIKGIKPGKVDLKTMNLSYIDNRNEIFMRKKDIMNVYIMREYTLKFGTKKMDRITVYSDNLSENGKRLIRFSPN